MLVGREPELAAIAETLDTARGGRRAALCLEGEPGVGKTTLLEAGVASAAGFRCVRSVGVEADLALGHAALLELLTPLRDHLGSVPYPQADALSAAVGWSPGEGGTDRYLVAAATMSLLADAAVEEPLLLVLDDVQWIDRESVRAIAFAARRLRYDRIAFLFARRTPESGGDDLDGLPRRRLTGLSPAAAGALLAGTVAARVVTPLVQATQGNPLALDELARSLTPEQRRGSAPLPDVLPFGERLAAGFGRTFADLSPGARRATVLAAVSGGRDAGPVVAALRAADTDVESALAETERRGVLTFSEGTLAFVHPLLRTAALNALSPADRRAAHAALAGVLGHDPDRRTRHRSQAELGPDDDLAGEVEALAARERRRQGFAAASALQERAARLYGAAPSAAEALAVSVEDALLAGDLPRARNLAEEVVGGAAPPAARARALLCLGILEEYAGSVPQSVAPLREAASCGAGAVRLRALTELIQVGYRLGSPATVSDIAAEIVALADPADDEQAMLADFARAVALGFGGRLDEARPPALRALERLETDPRMRDEPSYLTVAVLACAWAGDMGRALEIGDRRLSDARSRGALGVLPPVLSLAAGATLYAGDHRTAYAAAGEGVELGEELGYVADVATCYELLAWEEAARGRHGAAEDALAAARRLAQRAGVSAGAVQVHLVEAFLAVCRGDLVRVAALLEARIEADGGRLPRGDHELAVAPDLVEAYLGLGRRAEATALARRYSALYDSSPVADVRAHVERLRALVTEDDALSVEAFERAHRLHAEPFAAARTRLLHGARLRRSGDRVAARTHLRAAHDSFDAMGLDAWAARADHELAATGQRVRRGAGAGTTLTSQETRVALLVARGMSNREIAAALFLSPKTVEHHVTAVLRKRGVRTRAAIAASMALSPAPE